MLREERPRREPLGESARKGGEERPEERGKELHFVILHSKEEVFS
jgi:hypothetical protein